MTEMNYERTNASRRLEIQQLSRADLQQFQLRRLNELLTAIMPTNQFYISKFDQPEFRGSAFQLGSLSDLAGLSYTTKSQLLGDGTESDEPTACFARNRTYALDDYCRFHRTSGTRGQPMVVLDTQSDWDWWMETWQYVLDSAAMVAADRVVMAFSFGPFIGFWSAFDAAVERGCMVAPTGAMTSLARLELIQSIGATVVFCTPSYALHLVEVANENNIDLTGCNVRSIVVAGEPGGSIPTIRNQIESSWGAKVIDHSGASEVGPWGFADPAGRGIYINEAQFLAEFISIETGELVGADRKSGDGELAELVLTTLGRAGSPVIRYRTGDLVRPTWSDSQPSNFVLLSGGVLGRADDMMIIRGVNVFPTSIEQILRGFPDVIEYRLTAYKESAMDQLKIEVEDELQQPERIKQALQVRLGLRVEIVCVPRRTLPRFEAKGKRFVDNR